MAQLVAHPLDVREVTSSSLVSSTINLQLLGVAGFSFVHAVYMSIVRAELTGEPIDVKTKVKTPRIVD